MKWTRSELLKLSGRVTFEEDVVIDNEVFNDNPLINGVEDVRISGTGFLDDENDCFYVGLHVEGTMIVPDSITNEDLELPFDTESSEIYSFEETDEDGARIVSGEVIDLLEAVIEDILLEVPLQVTDAAEGELPEGNGWKVYTEAEYQESRKDQLDPRLAKLKQFKSE